MKSMTGYGLSRWKSHNCYIEAVVQSYNSRHFELKVQIPPFYSALEGELRKELRKKFNRGCISLLITRSPSWPERKTCVRWNKKQALKWRAVYKDISKSLKIKNNLDLMALTQQKGVLDIVSLPSLVPAREKNQLKALTRKALDLCNKERAREGLALKKEFQKHIQSLSVSLQKIKDRSSVQETKAGKNIKNKINMMEGGTEIMEDKKTVQEMTGALINRMDAREEICRMKEHIRAFHALALRSLGPVGKEMSFYLQEMIREMNTIGSKSQDFKLTQAVVRAKTFIERMREQVQNVE